MAQAGTVDINVEECLKILMTRQGMIGYVIFNYDGIPIKRLEKFMTHEQSVQYACLISDIWHSAKKIVLQDMNDANNELETIRLRTKQYTELIISQHGEYTIVGIQNCTPDYKPVDDVVVTEEKKKD